MGRVDANTADDVGPDELRAGIDASGRLRDVVVAMTTDGLDTARLAAEQERILADLPVGARTITLAMWGPHSTHVAPPTDPIAWDARLAERARLLMAGEDLLEQALSGRVRDTRSLGRLWHDLKYGGRAIAYAVATTLAVSAEIPLSLLEPKALWAAGDPQVTALLGLAAGRAGRHGCEQALRLSRLLLAHTDADDPVTVAASVGAVKGLGDGSVEEGFAWLVQAARNAVWQRDSWSEACSEAALLALVTGSEHAVSLCAVALTAAEDDEAAATELDGFLGAADGGGGDLAEALIAQWNHWSPPVRAALLEHVDIGLTEAAPWLRDRSEAVLNRALAALRPADVSRAGPEARRALLDLVDHPSEDVRGAVTTLLVASSTAVTAPRSLPAQAGAQVVSLPPSILARSPLDRLRAAIYTGDSDAIPTLVEEISPSERAAAARELFAAVEIPDMALRRAAVEALGAIGEVSDAEGLVDVARRYRTLEGLVVHTLVRLQARGQVPALGELFRRRLKWADDQAIDDFCELAGDARVEHLLEAVETRFYPAARAGAARAIARTGMQEGVFSLRKMSLSDPQEDARMAATAGLQALNCTMPTADELAGYALLFRPIGSLEEAVARAVEAGSASLPGVRKTLRHGSWKRRRAACDVLAGVPGEAATEALVDVLTDQDEDVRLSALQALSKRGWRPSNPRERTLAAVAARQPGALLEGDQPVDVDVLEEALSLGGHVFRNEILDTLERLPGWQPRDDIGAVIRATRLDAAGALKEAGGLEVLLVAVDRTWQAIPHRARLTRALLGVPPAVLTGALDEIEGGWRAREAVARALARPGDSAAADALERFVLDDDDDVRKAALQSLARVGTRRAAEVVARGVESPFREDRRPVAWALGALDEMALPTMRALIDSPWWEARQVAAMALADWRGDLAEAADLLIELAVDPEHRVSQPALQGLEEHGVQPSPEGVRRALARAQIETVRGLEPWLRLGPWRALEDPRAVVALKDAIDAAPAEKRPQRLGIIAMLRARELAPWLQELTRDEHLGVRLAAAEALRELGAVTCHLCAGRGSMTCPGCRGEGEQRCRDCGGRGQVATPCPEPDCNARETTRAIHSKPCKTCRGRGVVMVPCECGTSGNVMCPLCHGAGRIRCLLCEGTGDPFPGAAPKG